MGLFDIFKGKQNNKSSEGITPKNLNQNKPEHGSDEIEKTLSILRTAKYKFGESPLLNQIIDSLSKDVTNDKEKWLEYVRKKLELINNRVYQVILLDLEEELSSGKHHANRGLLSLSGRVLFDIANAILDEFAKTDYWPESEIAEQKKILTGNMQNIG